MTAPAGLLLLVASIPTARATLALLEEQGEPVGARRWLVYPPLVLTYLVLVVGVFVAAPALVATAADPTVRADGELDTPKGVERNVKVMTTALSTGGNRDYTLRVFSNGRHNLMDMSGAAPNEFARLQRFVPGLFDLMAGWLERVTRADRLRLSS